MIPPLIQSPFPLCRKMIFSTGTHLFFLYSSRPPPPCSVPWTTGEGTVIPLRRNRSPLPPSFLTFLFYLVRFSPPTFPVFISFGLWLSLGSTVGFPSMLYPKQGTKLPPHFWVSFSHRRKVVVKTPCVPSEFPRHVGFS